MHNPLRRPTSLVALALTCLLASTLAAQDRYYVADLQSLRLEGELPGAPGQQIVIWQMMQQLTPRASIEGGEAFFHHDHGGPGGWQPWDIGAARRITARVPQGTAPKGTLYLPNEDLSGLLAVPFEFEPDQSSDRAERDFLEAKAAYYDHLRNLSVPGAAYFRWQSDLAWRALETRFDADPAPRRFIAQDNVMDTYGLFTGGRAISENIQLNRDIAEARAPGDDPLDGQDVPISTITGVTVRAMDFKARLGDAQPVLDSLASSIPAGQHAIFFPSFDALAAVARETSEDGLPIFRTMRPTSEDAGLIARYEQQLGVSTRGLAGILGPLGVKTIAITGSDPYFPTGTDIAVLFEARSATALHGAILQLAVTAREGLDNVEVVAGEIQGTPYKGVVTADRGVSSYVSCIGETVVVTNSKYQLEQIALVKAGLAPALASLDEYRFFRHRYPLGDADESAFVMISDATIRRWCGPEWRIGASRRLRAGAILSDMTAANMSELVSGVGAARPAPSEVPMRTIGETLLTPWGARSSVYNTLYFLTPIAELGITQVGADEERAYNAWRETYQRNWSWAFDPIAIRLGVGDERLTADVSVMPLIMSSQYRMWLSFTQGAKIAAGSGDPHDALAHAVFAVNQESMAVQSLIGFARTTAPGLDADPLAWLGQTVAIYADPSPFWDEMLAKAAERDDEWLQENVARLPVALRAEVKSPLGLTAFLTTVRTFIESASPGMMVWENRSHNGQVYVVVRLSDEAQAAEEEFPSVVVYYAPMPRALTITLDEDTLRRAIEREQARGKARADAAQGGADHAGEADGGAEGAGGADGDADGDAARGALGGAGDDSRPWLGESMAIQFSGAGMNLINLPGGETVLRQMQSQCWGNLPILNEWRRLFPGLNPVDVHEVVWGVRLFCPAGGKYVWNERFQTMESTALGHPGEPREHDVGLGPLESIESGSFGLTFEDDGLRAKGDVRRRK